MEILDVINDVCTKYSYSVELKEALKRCIPVMIDGKSEEEIKLLVQALYNVEIFIFDKSPTEKQLEDIDIKKGSLRNSHVKYEQSASTSYLEKKQKQEPAENAYCFNLIFDKEMNVIDKLEYIYLTKLREESTLSQTYGTTIDLSHLIHELGHAWASQKNAYKQDQDVNIELRMGFRKISIMVDKTSCTIKDREQKGLYIEEAMNTVEEENAITKLMRVSKVDEINGYSKSTYQRSLMCSVMRAYLNIIRNNTPFQKARIFNDYSGLEKFQNTFLRTTFIKKMHDEKYISEKKNIFLSNIPKNAKEFFERNHCTYFSAQNKESFLENLDNVLAQLFALTAGWSITRIYWQS